MKFKVTLNSDKRPPADLQEALEAWADDLAAMPIGDSLTIERIS